MTISDKQKMILDFIKEYLQEHGYPPTIREICRVLSIASTSTVCYHLRKIEEMGLIKRQYKDPRAIRILGYRIELVPEEVQ